jgi:hypothetical protein
MAQTPKNNNFKSKEKRSKELEFVFCKEATKGSMRKIDMKNEK